MALFKDEHTFGKYVEVSANIPFERLLPSIRVAEAKLTREILGSAQYAALHTAYQTASSENALTNNELNLLEAVRPAIANYTMALAIPRLQITLSGAGVHIQSDDKKKTAFAWQIKQGVDSFNIAGDFAADTLLDFLETNKATYTLWASSSNYTIFKECFINTTALYDSIRNIGMSRRVFMALRPSMKYIQDKYIIGALGEAYSAVLLAEVASGVFTGPNEKPLDLVRKAVAYLSSATAALEMSVSIDPEGILVRASSNADEPSIKAAVADNRLASLSAQWQKKGEEYIAELVAFLNKNASASDYVDYYNSDNYSDPSEGAPRFTNDSNASVGLF